MAVKNPVLEFIVIENNLDQSDCIIFQISIFQKLYQVKSLLFACNKKISMEAAIWSWRFSWVWSGMPGMPIVL